MRDSAYYRSLPYTRKVDLRTDPDGAVYFLAFIEEIPPLRIHGSSREEALLRLDEVFDDVIESMLENAEEIPEPERWPGRARDVDIYRHPTASTVTLDVDKVERGDASTWDNGFDRTSAEVATVS